MRGLTGEYMMKVGFVTNPDKDPNMVYTKELVEWVRDNGCKALIADPVGELKNEESVNAEYIYGNADFVVVLGGDGTILRVARHAAKFDVPIQGINIGTLGYLADVERNDAKWAIRNVIEGKYHTDRRMMLEAYIERDGAERVAGIALNEVYVTNSVFSRVIQLRLEINDDYLSSYRADGIIVSTPTGSTAYNLSAGGPILKPDTDLIAITHVCPHSLTARPFVVSGNDVMRIQVESTVSNVVLNMDGQEIIPLMKDDVVIVRKSKYVTKTIRTTDMSFYDVLRNKMFECGK